MTSPQPEPERASIEERHPIVRNAARKGLGCGIVGIIAAGVVAFFLWSLSPLAPIGVAYSAVGWIPWLIGAGVVLLVIRFFTRRR